MPIRVFIVDDHPLIRHGFEAILNEEPDIEVHGTAHGAEEAVEALRETPVDVVVVDLSLGEVNGLALVRELQEQHADIRSIVSSVHDEKVYGAIALQAGAMGYVEKRETPEILVNAIRSVNAGKIAVSENVTQSLLNQSRGEKSRADLVSKLSEKELQVLQQIGDGMETKEIAVSLGVSRKTIDTYRERIKTKLGLPNATRLVHFATLWSSL